MQIVNLVSGSRGNSTLVITNKYNILIDVGISMKAINEKLLISEGLDLEDVSFILLTHSSHIDHCKSIATILRKYKHITIITDENVFIETQATLKQQLPSERFLFIKGLSEGNNVNVESFPVNHDKETVGYIVTEKDTNETYMHIPDNGGIMDKHFIETHKNHTYYSIESNHDLTLQINDTTRHEGLKRRVLGYYGHSSNDKAMELAFKLIGENTKAIQFHHLSEHCNSEELAQLTHRNLIKIWGKVTEFKNIRISYARQNDIVEL